uniref:Uncharacterized protein n=1 Tax=Arundo donax TaxID=35708 RepID=A0A0A8YH20_ARUDO
MAVAGGSQVLRIVKSLYPRVNYMGPSVGSRGRW